MFVKIVFYTLQTVCDWRINQFLWHLILPLFWRSLEEEGAGILVRRWSGWWQKSLKTTALMLLFRKTFTLLLSSPNLWINCWTVRTTDVRQEKNSKDGTLVTTFFKEPTCYWNYIPITDENVAAAQYTSRSP